MNLTQLMTEKAKSIVNVTYPDGKGNHNATLREIADRFQQESEQWRNDFFRTLLTEGKAITRMGGEYILR